jgi:hypothetical protein
VKQPSKTAVILAETEGFGHVSKCECGAIHVVAAGLEATFSPDAYRLFVDLILKSEPSFAASEDLPPLSN